MGTIKGNYEERSIELQSLLYGDNEFETATLKVSNGGSGAINVPDGAVLVRSDDGNYAPATAEDTDKAVAVLVDGIITPITAAGDYAVRVCISGRVNRNMLTVAGAAVTDAQVDILRDYGILALPTREA